MIDPKKQKSPNLTAALMNPYLKSASYALPDGTIIIDPRKPTTPNLSSALQNPLLMNASFRLPDGVQDPNIPISPNLAKVGCRFIFSLMFYRVPVICYSFFLISLHNKLRLLEAKVFHKCINIVLVLIIIKITLIMITGSLIY